MQWRPGHRPLQILGVDPVLAVLDAASAHFGSRSIRNSRRLGYQYAHGADLLRLFLENGFKTVTFNDFFPATFKTAIFGFIIGLVASFRGMRTTEHRRRGRSATSSVVLCSLFIILADVLLVRMIQAFSHEERWRKQRTSKQ
jgi:hypothetical protein